MSQYELIDFEWRVIESLLPTSREAFRASMIDAFSMLSSGCCILVRRRAICPNQTARATCYNRFVRWRKAGVWDRMIHSYNRRT
jgi:transposase